MLHETSQESIAVLEDPGPTWFGRPPIRYDLVVEILRVLLVRYKLFSRGQLASVVLIMTIRGIQ